MMKKIPIKLTVRRETLRRLAKHALPDAAGGRVTTCTSETRFVSGCPGPNPDQ